MRTVTVADGDFTALGGGARRGFLQVWRLTRQGDVLDAVKLTEHRTTVDSFTLLETDESTGYRITPRGVPSLSESWTVGVPPGAPISLSDLIADHSIDTDTLLPLDPTKPTLLQTIRQIVQEEAWDTF